MRSSSVAAALLLSGLCTAAPELQKRFGGPSDPARFKFFPTPSKGVICDGDTGPDGLTLWYEDFAAATVGYINYQTGEIKEFTIPYSTAPFPKSALPGIGNTTALQCVVRTGKDGMVYAGSGIRNQVVRIDPRTSPPTLKIFSPVDQDPAANLQPFNDAWGAPQGLFFSQQTGDVVTKFDYVTHKFTNYPCPTAASGPLGMRTDKYNNLWFTNFFGQYLSKLNNVTGEITEYKSCCPLPGGAFPEVLRSSTENQKYLWANAFGGGGYIRIEPGASSEADMFKVFTNPHGTATFPFENSNDFCGRVWYTSPDLDILVYYTPSTNTWTTVDVPVIVGVTTGIGGNFEVIMHRGPGHYMWFSVGTLGQIGRYSLDADCVGQPQ